MDERKGRILGLLYAIFKLGEKLFTLPAARAVDGLLAVPCFPDTRKQQNINFNDLARLDRKPSGTASSQHNHRQTIWWSMKSRPGRNQYLAGRPPTGGTYPPGNDPSFPSWLADGHCRPDADPSVVAAVVALGSIIGLSCGIQPKRHDDWLVVPNLWGCGRRTTVTPAVSEAHRHLVRLESEAREAYLNATQEFEIFF